MNPHSLSARLGKKLLLEGKECLFFNGTSYLGLDSLEAYGRIVESNVQKWGTHHGLSRTNNVRLAIYDAFEEFFSNQAGAESSALFSSGYLAGIAASQYLFPKSDQCLAAPDTHPAILPSGIQADSSLSFPQWIHACLEGASQLPSQRILILGNAVDLDLDGAGRILVSPELRAAADIEKEVILLGMGSHLELWDAATYAAKEQAAIAQGMPEALKQFNF